MIRFATGVLSLACAAATLAAPASDVTLSTPNATGTVQMEPPALDALVNPETKPPAGITDLRAQMLREAARTVGFRGGMAARAVELRRALDVRADGLDTMFQFAPLVSKNGTVPPVITAAQDVAKVAPDQIRTANHVYKIEREERFVSVPPTWRDYLTVGLPTKAEVSLPDSQVRPQNEEEHVLWKTAVEDGWARGRRQADAIVAANFNRLVRDYTGMMLYATLLQQGMISGTRVAESKQTLTGDKQEVILGDTLRRLTGRAGFETDPKKWRPTLRSEPGPAGASSQSPTPSPAAASAPSSK